MTRIKTAIILAAGLGSRLKPITNENPKCMAEVKGKSILMHNLDLLEKNGIQEAVIVIGYLGQKIIEKVGDSVDNMKISYIWNNDYAHTNSMYSLWLARDYLEKGSLVIEGDCIYEEYIIRRLLQSNNARSYWGANRFTEQNDGCMLTAENGQIIKIDIVREKLSEYRDNFYKSAGLLKIESPEGMLISRFLDDEVKKNNVEIYYDLVLAGNINDVEIFIMDIGDLKWFEIDSINDLKIAESLFEENKYVVIVCDGSADLPVKELGNRTPFESARIPKIHELAKNGATFLTQTSYKGLPVGSIVACLGLLGYDPHRYYPNGRASFEAMAQGVFLEDNDICFRCNLISTSKGKIKDFTAGMLNTNDAINIIDNLNFNDSRVELYIGQSYRHILVLRNALCNANEILAYEPHMNIGQKINEKLLESLSVNAKEEKNLLNKLINLSIPAIKNIKLKYKSKADMIWLWSPSSAVKLPSFYSKHNLSGAVVAGLDFMNGIGEAANMGAREIPGATGYIDTNLKEKLKFAKNFLRNNDFVFIHVNMTDEASHMKAPKLKVKCIERIHDELIAPIMNFLEEKYSGKYRIAFLPDHYTLLKDGTHQPMDVPSLIYGAGIEPDASEKFSEKEIIEKSDIKIKSYEFIDFIKNQSEEYEKKQTRALEVQI